MFKRFTALSAVLIGSIYFMPSASAVPTGDCHRVAAADRTLCRSVQAQHPYGWTDSKGNPQTWVPSGKVVVRDITHQGLTKGEMRDYLQAEARNYRDHVTQIKINSDAVLKRCGSDGMGAVTFVDEDGKPGGRKYTWARIICA